MARRGLSSRCTAIDGAARAGVLRTAHGEIRTPVFMPVGTKATVKTLHPDEVRDARRADPARQHLPPALPPGRRADRASSAACTASWAGTRPILTDSGGFQVFSLRDTIARVDDDGVTFRSVYDGAATRFTPELAARIQANLGSDIAMCLDQVPPAGVTRRRARGGRAPHDRSGRERQRHAPRAEGQLRFGITQGGVDPELRRRSTEEIAALDFDGNAIGGLAIGEDRDAMFETTDWATALMPADKPRYFMGIGDPEGILEVIEAGVDMFDCVLPTRTARTGSALTYTGRLNLRNAQLRTRPSAARRRLRLPGLHALHAAPTSAISSTRTSCSGCASSRSTIYASSSS